MLKKSLLTDRASSKRTNLWREQTTAHRHRPRYRQHTDEFSTRNVGLLITRRSLSWSCSSCCCWVDSRQKGLRRHRFKSDLDEIFIGLFSSSSVNTHRLTESDFWYDDTFKKAAMTFARRWLLHMQQRSPAARSSLSACDVVGLLYSLRCSSWSLIRSHLSI